MTDRYATLPNALSIFRIFLVIPIVLLYYNDFFVLALALLFISGLTDILDGKIARAWNMQSNLGRALDPLADKITFVSLITLFGWSVLPHHGIIMLIILELFLLTIGMHAYFRPYPRGCFFLGANRFGKMKIWGEAFLIGFLIIGHFLNFPSFLLILKIFLGACIWLAGMSLLGHIFMRPPR